MSLPRLLITINILSEIFSEICHDFIKGAYFFSFGAKKAAVIGLLSPHILTHSLKAVCPYRA